MKKEELILKIQNKKKEKLEVSEKVREYEKKESQIQREIWGLEDQLKKVGCDHPNKKTRESTSNYSDWDVHSWCPDCGWEEWW